MANITRAERERRASGASARDEAKYGAEFGGTAYATLQDDVDARNAIDERAPDRRPATVINHDEQTTFEDKREFAPDMGAALNQMVGRAAITENHDPHPAVTAAENPPVVTNPIRPNDEGEGELVQVLRGYVPMTADLGITGQGEKRIVGQIVREPRKEARRLVNLGAAKFVEVD